MSDSAQSFLHRHEFLIRRLHSLTGLIPVGAFMCVHLLTNASVLDGAGKFQANVYGIHALGKALVPVEWTFIFLPIIFHAVIGVWIVAGGLPNQNQYPYGANIRYSLQRLTGMIAFVFIMYHVLHMHGWFHTQWWLTNVAEPLGGAKFRPYNAASSAGAALQSPWMLGFYALGIVSCVFHLANGIWSMGITWGVWTSPNSQRWALRVCGVFGVALGCIGLGALYGMWRDGHGEAYIEARKIEDQMYEHKIESGALKPEPHKRIEEEEGADEPSDQSASVLPAGVPE